MIVQRGRICAGKGLINNHLLMPCDSDVHPSASVKIAFLVNFAMF